LKQDLTPVPYHSIDKSGFLKRIKFLKPKARCLNGKRYAMSVIRIIELFRCKPANDTSTITDAPTYNKARVEDIIKFIPKSKILKKLPYTVLPSYLPLSNKAGPNGPATLSAVEDMTALRRNPKQYYAVTTLLNQSNLSWLNFEAQAPLLGEFINAKTIFLSDKACKTRLISIMGWWSNAALSGVHKTWMYFLKDISNDLTFKQETIPRRVKALGRNLFSSDMTAFTDRFPRVILVAMLRHCHGQVISENWNTIMSETAFKTKSGNDIKYEVGNPMGVLSSWPISTGGHHLIHEYVQYKLKIRKHKYLVLGDDSLIKSEKAQKYYLKVINELGIKISLPKCTSSYNGHAEFAKRLFGSEAEYTGLPIYLLKNLHKHPEQILELVKMARERGYSDEILGRRILNLLELKQFDSSTRKIIVDILSLSERVSGFRPLFQAKEYSTEMFEAPLGVDNKESWSGLFNGLPIEVQDKYIAYANDMIFWETARKLNLNSPNTHVKGKINTVCNIQPHHPLVFAFYSKLNDYLEGVPTMLDTNVSDDNNGSNVDFNAYTIYEAWMRGEYRYLARLPSIDTYNYNTVSHKVTACKYEVLKKAILLLKSDNANIFLNPVLKLSDDELYDIGFGSLQKALGISE